MTTNEIAGMERRLAALGHVVVDYDRYNVLLADQDELERARHLARGAAAAPDLQALLTLLTGVEVTEADIARLRLARAALEDQ